MSCDSRFDPSRTELGRFWGGRTALWAGPKLSWGRVEGCRVDGGGCDGVSELGDLVDWGTWVVEDWGTCSLSLRTGEPGLSLATVSCSHQYSAQCCLHLSKVGDFGKAQVKLCELGDW